MHIVNITTRHCKKKVQYNLLWIMLLPLFQFRICICLNVFPDRIIDSSIIDQGESPSIKGSLYILLCGEVGRVATNILIPNGLVLHMKNDIDIGSPHMTSICTYNSNPIKSKGSWKDQLFAINCRMRYINNYINRMFPYDGIILTF